MMVLFKRWPALHWSPPPDEPIVPTDAQMQHAVFSADFKELENELLPHFRELSVEALRVQNQFRRQQVVLIFGGACATVLGAMQSSLGSSAAVWAGIFETVLAAILAAVALRAQTTHAQEFYFTNRLKAERLRAEYFLFLARVGIYEDPQDRLPNLIRRIAEIKSGGAK